MMIESFLQAVIRASTPLLLAATGELLVEESGLINIGIEGVMLTAAFFAMATAYFTGNLGLALGAAVASALLMSAIFAFMAVNLTVNQVVVGTAIDIFAAGLTGVLYRRFFGVTGRALTVRTLRPIALGPLAHISFLGPLLFHHNALVYIAVGAVPISAYLLFHTRYGMRLRAVGERPEAADALGLAVYSLRWQVVMISGVFTGLAGAYLTLAYTNTFVEGISAGRGFVALAIVIVGRWRAGGVFASSILFGGAIALQFLLQALGSHVPYQFFLALPYLIALAVLGLLGGGAQAPSSLGEPYTRT